MVSRKTEFCQKFSILEARWHWDEKFVEIKTGKCELSAIFEFLMVAQSRSLSAPSDM